MLLSMGKTMVGKVISLLNSISRFRIVHKLTPDLDRMRFLQRFKAASGKALTIYIADYCLAACSWRFKAS